MDVFVSSNSNMLEFCLLPVPLPTCTWHLKDGGQGLPSVEYKLLVQAVGLKSREIEVQAEA